MKTKEVKKVKSRVCTHCTKRRPIKYYYKHTLSLNGRRRICKKCCAEYQQVLLVKRLGQLGFDQRLIAKEKKIRKATNKKNFKKWWNDNKDVHRFRNNKNQRKVSWSSKDEHERELMSKIYKLKRKLSKYRLTLNA